MSSTGSTRNDVAFPYASLLPLIGVVSVFAIMQGATYPLLAVRLEAMGYGGDMIGLSGAMTPIGILLAAPFFPTLIRLLGTAASLLVCSAMTLAVLGALPSYPNYEVWLGLRLVLGVSIGGLFVIGETGLQKLTSDEARGRLMGIYTAIALLGYAAGPMLLSFIGTRGWLPFVSLFAIVGLAGLIVVAASRLLPTVVTDDETSTYINAPLLFAFAAPALLFAAGAVAVFDHAVTSFMPLYGVAKGVPEGIAMRITSIVMVGAMVGQFVVGWLADRWGVTPVMIGCCGVVAVGAGAMVPLIATPWAWPLVSVWGAAAFGPLTLAMTELGRRFTGNMILIGNVAINMTWGLSQTVGSPVVGTAMEIIKPDGFALVLGLLFASVAISYVVRGVRTGAFKAARQGTA